MRKIEFGGYTWNIKDSESTLAGPGPNYFTSDPECVFTDENGLHLKTRQNGEGKWECAEAALDQPLGFGEYSFSLSAPVHDLEKNTVLAGFLYENDTQELDIEFSHAMAGKHGGQFVVQPGNISGNLKIFKFPSTRETFHKIIWTSAQVEFESWEGSGADRKLIASWKRSGPGIGSPDRAVFIFNLWLYKGKSSRRAEEVVVQEFGFKPTAP